MVVGASTHSTRKGVDFDYYPVHRASSSVTFHVSTETREKLSSVSDTYVSF